MARPQRRRAAVASPSDAPLIDLSRDDDERQPPAQNSTDDVLVTEVRLPDVSFQGMTRRQRQTRTQNRNGRGSSISSAVVNRLVRSPAFRSLTELFARSHRRPQSPAFHRTSDDESWNGSDSIDSESSFDDEHTSADESVEDEDYDMDYETEEDEGEDMDLFPSDEEEYDDDLEDADYETYIALAEHLGEVKQRGLPSADIPHLPERIFSRVGDSIETCAVCLSTFEEGAPLVSLPCHHEFHWDCGANWLAQNASCPVCRAPVKVNSPENPVAIT